jgi:tetratricopeptide (TPR) repeat protein
MKRFFLSAFLILGVVYSQAQSIVTPQASPVQTIKQNFSVANVELSYSRPGLKGRKFGTDVVPYGKLWRTGANAATVIQFSEDVTIGGTRLKAGKYGILSIPDANEWVLIITKDVNVNDPNLYKQENDAVRVKLPVMKLAEKVETLTINFANLTSTTCDLQLTWANSAVALPISINTDEIVMKQINDIFNKDNKPYYAAAQYYYETGKDITKAKEWIDKATTDPANEKAFYMYLLKARIYQKSGDKAGAKANAEKTIVLSTEVKNPEFVKMAQDLIKTL